MIERDEPTELEERGDELEGQADRMEQKRDKVSGHIDEARRDWEAKKSDESVPGAVEDDMDADSEDESG